MAVLATFIKQPSEIQDFDFDFASEYLSDFNDTADTFVVVADPGITNELSSMTDGVVKVWLSGGTDGQRYKVTVRVVSVGGRTHEADIYIKVKES